MAATVRIRSHHGIPDNGGDNVDGSTIRFKQADNDSGTANNPIPIPGAGSNFSWIKQLRFNAETTPDNTIDNLKFFSDGTNSFGTGVLMNVVASGAYTDPTVQQDSALGGTSDAFSFNSGSPLSLTGSINNPSTGAFGDFVVMQMEVQSTASQGNTPVEGFTFQYDES